MIKLCPSLVYRESRIALNYRHEFGTLPSMDPIPHRIPARMNDCTNCR
ncbi:MAG: hypothetical protein JWM30_1475 [Burkholderia sp.]|jgi:hypothetical protein|nr:hypothetical protein [Burkholderia sp.]